MNEVFSPQVVSLVLTGLAVLVGVLAVLIYVKVVKPRVEASLFWTKYGNVMHYLDTFITDVVLNLAFAPVDLEKFRTEAETTGRDIRLVAAIHFVDDWTEKRGIHLDENEIIIMVEARLAALKQNGALDNAKPVEPTPTEAANRYQQ